MQEENLSLNQYPSKHWEKFFNKFNEIETLPVKDWNSAHLIAYFCKLYKNNYNQDYTFHFNSSAPSKSYEVFNMNKLSHMISANPSILKDYIDWFWQTQIQAKKKRITSMAFLTNVKTANLYKTSVLLASNIDRTTKLPPNIIELAKQSSITTYGELAFMKKCIDAGTAEQTHKDCLSAIIGSGFDIALLEKVK